MKNNTTVCGNEMVQSTKHKTYSCFPEVTSNSLVCVCETLSICISKQMFGWRHFSCANLSRSSLFRSWFDPKLVISFSWKCLLVFRLIVNCCCLFVRSFNHDGDKISYGYMTFSCGRSGDSDTVNGSMQLIMILNDYFFSRIFIKSMCVSKVRSFQLDWWTP